MSDPSTNNIGMFASTKPIRMWAANLFEPKAVMVNGKARGDAKFNGSFVIEADHPDLPALKNIARTVARAKWPGVELKEVNWPFKDGTQFAAKKRAEGKKTDDLFEGKVMLTGRSKYQPKMAVIVNGKVVDLDSDEIKAKYKGHFYAGVEVLAEMNFVAQEVDGKKYVSIYLNTVLSTNKGTKLASGRSAADTFSGYVGHHSADNPMSGADADDEIPF